MRHWNYNTVRSHETTVSLHDCTVKRMFFRKDDLVIDFPEIFVAAHCHGNPYDGNAATGAARVTLKHARPIACFTFHDWSLGRHELCAVRKRISVTTLIEKINKDKWSVEFLYDYHLCDHITDSVLIYAVVHSRNVFGKYTQFFVEMIFDCERMEYRWNEFKRPITFF